MANQSLHCQGCGRCLAKYDAGALKPGKAVEIKCRDCKRINRLEGHALGLVGSARDS